MRGFHLTVVIVVVIVIILVIIVFVLVIIVIVVFFLYGEILIVSACRHISRFGVESDDVKKRLKKFDNDDPDGQYQRNGGITSITRSVKSSRFALYSANNLKKPAPAVIMLNRVIIATESSLFILLNLSTVFILVCISKIPPYIVGKYTFRYASFVIIPQKRPSDQHFLSYSWQNAVF